MRGWSGPLAGLGLGARRPGQEEAARPPTTGITSRAGTIGSGWVDARTWPGLSSSDDDARSDPDPLAGLDADRRPLAAQQFAGSLALPRVRGVAQARCGCAGRTSRRRLYTDRPPRSERRS